MAPSSYRLDHLAVLLIERLEATRRAHLTDPVAAEQALRRVTVDLIAGQAMECRQVLGDDAQAHRIEKEGVETFLPRYIRLALAQNREEARGYGLIFPDHLLGRAAATLVMLLVATLLVRLFPNPLDLAFFLLPFVTPFLPELRAWSAKRRYEAELQAVADDLGRLQDADERLAPLPSSTETTATNPRTNFANASRAAERQSGG